MKEQRITVEIDAEGKLTADAHGFTGGTCLKELENLLDGLAAPCIAVTRKSETSDARVVSERRVSAQNQGKGQP